MGISNGLLRVKIAVHRKKKIFQMDLSEFKLLDNVELSGINGGKIERITQWLLYNTQTHKYFADNSAIMGTTGQTIVNGWLEHGPWIPRT